MNKNWTEKENDTLRACYADTPTSAIAEWFNRSLRSVYMQANKLGLKKSESFLTAQNKRLSYEMIVLGKNKATQFKKGHTPVNKGKKQTEYMTKEAIDKTKATRFKKGNLPKSAYLQESGVITTRVDKRGVQYQFIKLAHGKWQPLHRYIWEQTHGLIPKGSKVVFKDGNTLNCNLENLQLVSSGELMLINSFINYLFCSNCIISY